MATCHDAEVFATDSFPGRGFRLDASSTQGRPGDYNYMYKA